MFTSNEEIRWLRRTGVPIQRIVAILAAHGRSVSRQKIAGICKGVPKPLKKCLLCGDTFNLNIWAEKLGANKFCSRKCAGINSRKLNGKYSKFNFVTRKCNQCGEKYTKSLRTGVSTQKFCSTKCAGAAKIKLESEQTRMKTVTLQCDHCDKDFKRTKHQQFGAKKQGCVNTFCSKPCYLAWKCTPI